MKKRKQETFWIFAEEQPKLVIAAVFVVLTLGAIAIIGAILTFG